MQALLVGSAWLAHETGHDQEERVEKVVDESHIEEHEEAADWVLWLAVAGLAAAALGLAGGSAGAWARAGALAISLATLAAAVRTGHLGGELVYRYGAANAYVEKPPTADARRVARALRPAYATSERRYSFAITASAKRRSASVFCASVCVSFS